MTCSLQLGVRRLTVPASLVLDECSRWEGQQVPYQPPLTLQAVHPGAAAAAWPLLPAGEPGVRVLRQQPGQVGQLWCLQCPLCSDTMVTRYLSPLEQQMVTQVVIGLSNVTYLSMQAVASNELGSFF